ncbi:MAG TPA: DUF3224 domain-containing protein [Pseudonocardiaceae bacterium]|jgi:hypothetical protein|nr:DUF3224 domain-containing protein [Pseudonocardiaceae bacterium]
MTTKTTAKATFQIASWDENPYAEFEGVGKLTRAVVTQTYAGDLVGEGAATTLMYYGAPDVPVYYTGLERFSGTVSGKTGTFVLQAKGVFADGAANTTSFVVPGSGTGELTGLRGDLVYEAVQGESGVSVAFDYYFEV